MARKSRIQAGMPIDSHAAPLSLVAVYGRLSQEDGDEESNSILHQFNIADGYLAQHPDLCLVDHYKDNGYTGMNFDRPDFRRMIEDIYSGKINCVIVKDISRLGRHFVQTCTFVEQIFPQMGIRLICINDDYDSADPSANTSQLTMPLKMVMNDYYVKDISKKIRSSITAKMDAGEFLPSSGSIPYGYLRDGTRNTYIIDEETAPIVQKIYTLRSQGMAFSRIAYELNEAEIPCPGRLRYERGFTRAEKYIKALWLRGTIRKITNDPVYIGSRVHGKCKRDTVGGKKQQRPQDEWQVIPHAHPAIISDALYRSVQQVNREEMARLHQREACAKPEMDTRSLFHGKVFCGDCGSFMMGGKGCARHNAKTPSRIFFDCNNYKYSQHKVCFSHYIRQEDLLKAVKDVLHQQIKTCTNIERILHEVQRSPQINRQQRSIHEKCASLSVKERNLEAKLDHLLIDLSESLIDREEYVYMKSHYTAQLDAVRTERASALADSQAFAKTWSTTKERLDVLKKYQNQSTIDRELVDALIDRIEVFGGRRIKITLKYEDPYQFVKPYLDTLEVKGHAG